MKLWMPLCALLMLTGCTTGTQDINLDNPNDPNGSSSIDAPEAVRAQVGDGEITLTWSMPEDSEDEATFFAVFRREISPDDTKGTERIAMIGEATYTDRSVRNGRVYGYQIAAGEKDGGPYGKRSEEIEVTPSLFSLVIENGARVTNDARVRVSFNAPSSTESFRLSENEDLTGAPHQNYAVSANWELSPGDGERTLYVAFRFSDGTESEIVSDSIEMDTKAHISRVNFSGADVRQPGDIVHFIVETGESNGEAYITVSNVFNRVDLFDDGTNGDSVAKDGVYEGEAVIPADKRAEQSTVGGRFTDAAGNTATTVEAARTLTVALAPESVVLGAPIFSQPPDVPSVTLRWSQSQIPDFDAYQVYRGEGDHVDSTDVVAASTTNQSTVELSDGDIEEGGTYSYRVYVRNDVGMLTGSNRIEAVVPNLRPPSAVNLRSTDGVTSSSVGLRWTASQDRDLESYKIYRSTETFVDDTGDLIATITDSETELFTDTGLTENTEYSYRLYTEDTGGLTTPGEQMMATTTNLPPLAVTLNPGADVDTVGVTLSWTVSDAHDFQSYRLYRDEGPGVGTFSTLVVEIEQQNVLKYRDINLEPGIIYYFRIFVFDDGTEPQAESAGSNTVSIETDSTD